MVKTPLVSILIGTRNRPEPLLRCLKSIFQQDYRSFEILILDDCSESLGVCAFLSKKVKDHRLKCFRSDRQLGVAGGRNFLMKKAKGEIFIVIDDDALFSDDKCVSRVVDHLLRNPEVGILAFKIVDHRGGRERLLVPFSKLNLRRNPELADEEHLVSCYQGGGHVLRREVIDRCGFYKDDLTFGAEELDLSYRAVQEGYKILYTPGIVVHHYPEPQVVSEGKGFSELYYRIRNRIWIGFKYIPFPYLPVYIPISMLMTVRLWLRTYGVRGLSLRDFGNISRGVIDGFRMVDVSKRAPLDRGAVNYLKRNFGRLWY